jgi:succinate-acetate transporter protein
MKRLIAVIALVGGFLGVGIGTTAWSAELTTIHTQKTKDAVITLKSETGQWKPGKNTFVLEFTSPSGQPLDAGKVTLSTSMAMPGMAPMVAGATLAPDKAPGQYLGTIDFTDRGTRQVTVTWDGPAGKGSAKFSVPVR